MSKIWFLGEALIDFVPTGSPAGPAFAPREGGSPFNAAKAAAQAGGEVGFLGAISTDMFGELLIKDLVAHKVDVSQTPRSADPSTLAFVQLTNGAAQYAFFNALSATALMNPDPASFTPGAGDILSFGSISLIDAPGAQNIADYAIAQSERALIALDPNARPTMTPDVAEWSARIASIAAKTGVLKLSDEDLELIEPGATPDAYAAARMADGVPLVLLTMGQDGVLGYCADGKVQVPGRTTQIVDTVGAGDTLMGSVLAEISLRDLTSTQRLGAIGTTALSDILRYAVIAASLNCEQSGCAPPPRTDVLALLQAENQA